jgi:hypothetical protein
MKLRHFVSGALAVVLLLGVLATASAAAQLAGLPYGGKVSLSTDRATPLFQLSSLRPGDDASSSITVRNDGEVDVSWELRADVRGDRSFLRHLRLRVDELAPSGRRRIAFSGSFASLRRVDLGVLEAGDRRRFVFRVSYPSGQDMTPPSGARARPATVDFSWRASGRA